MGHGLTFQVYILGGIHAVEVELGKFLEKLEDQNLIAITLPAESLDQVKATTQTVSTALAVLRAMVHQVSMIEVDFAESRFSLDGYIFFCRSLCYCYYMFWVLSWVELSFGFLKSSCKAIGFVAEKTFWLLDYLVIMKRGAIGKGLISWILLWAFIDKWCRQILKLG